MLIEILSVTISDFLPAKGVTITIADEPSGYRISERLHAAIKAEAEKQSVTIAKIFAALREEMQPTARLEN